MSLQQLIEQLNAIIDEDIMNEFEVDSRFKTALQTARDAQTADIKQRLKTNKDKELRAKLKGKRSADFVYKHLVDIGLDVSKSTIEFLGNCKDLDANTVKNKLQEKISAGKDLLVYLIADTKNITDLSDIKHVENSDTGFFAWKAEIIDGKLVLDNNLDKQYQSWQGDELESKIKGGSLLSRINKNAYPDWDFYMAYGPSCTQITKDRWNKKSVYDRYDLTNIDDWDKQYLDKSGYRLDVRQRDLLTRLKELKKEKGYKKQIEELQSMIPKVEKLASLRIEQGFNAEPPRGVKGILQCFYKCIEEFTYAIDSGFSDDRTVNKWYKKALDYADDLNSKYAPNYSNETHSTGGWPGMYMYQ